MYKVEYCTAFKRIKWSSLSTYQVKGNVSSGMTSAKRKKKDEEDRCEHTQIGRDYSVKIVAIQI